jgi:hypothetical protein
MHNLSSSISIIFQPRSSQTFVCFFFIFWKTYKDTASKHINILLNTIYLPDTYMLQTQGHKFFIKTTLIATWLSLVGKGVYVLLS